MRKNKLAVSTLWVIKNMSIALGAFKKVQKKVDYTSFDVASSFLIKIQLKCVLRSLLFIPNMPTYFLIFFWKTILCIPVWPWTLCVAKNDIKLLILSSAFASLELGLLCFKRKVWCICSLRCFSIAQQVFNFLK